MSNAQPEPDPDVTDDEDEEPDAPVLVIRVLSQARAKPSVRIETITPAIAAKWLEEANVHNRSLRDDHAVKLARIIEDGDFLLLTDCVGFDRNGVLINGQHRLAGCIIANRPIVVGVMRGLEPEAQDDTDTGLSRTFGDALKFMGQKDVHNLGAAIVWMHRLDYMWRTNLVRNPDRANAATIPVLKRRFGQDGEALVELVKRSHRVRRETGVRVGLLAAAWFHLWLVDPEAADEFMDKLRSGANLDEDDPIFVLRKMLINNRAVERDRKLPPYREIAVIFKAWNLWRDEIPVKHLSYKYGSSYKEPFPRPH